MFSLSNGSMAELVDALDSKSCGHRPCQFESDYSYHSEKTGFSGLFSFFLLFELFVSLLFIGIVFLFSVSEK